MAFATVALSKLYGKKGYRQQSTLNRGIGGVSMGGAQGQALRAAGFFNHFPEIAAAMPQALSDIVVETTESLAAAAGANAPKGATGDLAGSWKISYRHRSQDGGVVSGRVQSTAVNEDGEAYGFYVEVGTTFSPAQPFLVPALQAERPLYVQRLMGLEARLPR